MNFLFPEKIDCSPLNLGIIDGVPIAYLINKQVVSIKNNLTPKYDDDLELCSSFRISNLKLEEEEDFDVDRIIYKIYNFVIPSSANDFFEMNAEKDPDVENSVKAKAESHELLLCITQNGLKDWLPLDLMTINELGSYIKITQNKLLAESRIDEPDEVIDANSLSYKLKALSSLILNEKLSTSDLQTEFQQVLGGLDIEIGLIDIINEIHEQTNSVNKRISSVMYLVKRSKSISNIGGLMRVKEKMIRIVIEQLKHLMGGKVANFVKSFTFLTAITLYNFYHTFKSIYDIWDQFKKCDKLSKYLSEKKGYLKTHLYEIDYYIKKMLKSLNDDDAKYEDYLENFKDLNEKVEDFVIEVKVTAIHCRKIIDGLCEKKKNYEAVIGVGSSILGGVGLGLFGFRFLRECINKNQIITSLAVMRLSEVSLAVLAALSSSLGNKIENFDKTLDLFKDLHEKSEKKKNRHNRHHIEFVENKQNLIAEYELLV
ncbi:12883_t:CDS:2, partial [Entrophospora sp. SA101]